MDELIKDFIFVPSDAYGESLPEGRLSLGDIVKTPSGLEVLNHLHNPPPAIFTKKVFGKGVGMEAFRALPQGLAVWKPQTVVWHGYSIKELEVTTFVNLPTGEELIQMLETKKVKARVNGLVRKRPVFMVTGLAVARDFHYFAQHSTGRCDTGTMVGNVILAYRLHVITQPACWKWTRGNASLQVYDGDHMLGQLHEKARYARVRWWPNAEMPDPSVFDWETQVPVSDGVGITLHRSLRQLSPDGHPVTFYWDYHRIQSWDGTGYTVNVSMVDEV
ncbi:hypothetical protein AAL_01452 [Moelleriella libera RCEF 2490]|uniref:Uncharacterized protein n=1 Tax=Moelleriella libera RCEF 2490 TaxID=1081109 RepID=A0A166U6I1_9HYPO|nr:hypothetical protein AAL_01452 [Moelleriella libera RCEF 2490]